MPWSFDGSRPRCRGGQLNYIFRGLRRQNAKPFFGLGFCRQSFVVRVDHLWRVARLLRRQIFVGVQREVKRTKTVAQSVGFARDFRRGAKFAIVFQKCSFFTRPEFSSLAGAERFKPSPQCRGRFPQGDAGEFCFYQP